MKSMKRILEMTNSEIIETIQSCRLNVCVIGIGRIGLPTALSFARSGFPTIGIDINEKLVQMINSGDFPLKDRIAHVLLPTRVAAEKYGTLTNHAGHVQRLRPAVEPAFEALSEGLVLARLGAALGLAGFDGKFDAREMSRQLAANVPAFAGVDVDSVGDGGAPLASGVGA